MRLVLIPNSSPKCPKPDGECALRKALFAGNPRNRSNECNEHCASNSVRTILRTTLGIHLRQNRDHKWYVGPWDEQIKFVGVDT